MASLEQRLASLRLQLLLRLTTIMRLVLYSGGDAPLRLFISNLARSEEKSSVKATLNKIKTGNVSLHSHTAGELTAIQESIQQLKTALATQLSGDSGTIGPNPSESLA